MNPNIIQKKEKINTMNNIKKILNINQDKKKTFIIINNPKFPRNTNHGRKDQKKNLLENKNLIHRDPRETLETSMSAMIEIEMKSMKNTKMKKRDMAKMNLKYQKS